MSQVRADLTKHVGGKPSATQKALISRAAWLSLHIAMMDVRTVEKGAPSEHDSRVYLAWTGTLVRTLSQLGLQGVPERPPTLAELMAQPTTQAPHSASREAA